MPMMSPSKNLRQMNLARAAMAALRNVFVVGRTEAKRQPPKDYHRMPDHSPEVMGELVARRQQICVNRIRRWFGSNGIAVPPPRHILEMMDDLGPTWAHAVIDEAMGVDS